MLSFILFYIINCAIIYIIYVIIVAQFSKYKIMISQNRRCFLSETDQNVKFLSGRRGPDRPDLPSPFGENSNFQFHTCLMMGEASLKMSPKNMIQDMINSDNMFSLIEDSLT